MRPRPPRRRRSWGWVVALLLVIAALVAVAVLGTVLLTRDSESKVSQEEMVRSTIQNFDVAIQKGDLATLRSITCGATRDSYVNYNERAWADTHSRVAAAKQYPVVASIDEVVINGDHAEANVTTFMAYAPQTRSTRSFDLQFRDEQWKICQAPGSYGGHAPARAVQVVARLDDTLGHATPRPSSGSCAGRRPSCCRPRRRSSAHRRSW